MIPNFYNVAWSTGGIRIKRNRANVLFHTASPGKKGVGALVDNNNNGMNYLLLLQ
jgi:hypothetical protein